MLPLLELENELIITHGNGPGVGKVLMRQALAHKQVAPMSLDICDISLVESLSSSGTIVIAGGGGGVPVVRNCQGLRSGVEAVIDKDLTTAHMANVLGFKDIMILTAVSQVAINFGKPEQQELGHITVSEDKRYFEEGQFPARSTGA